MLILAAKENSTCIFFWPLYPWESDPVPFVQEAGCASWPAWTGMENLILTKVQTLDRPAWSMLLYWLCYPGCPTDKQLPMFWRTTVLSYFLDCLILTAPWPFKMLLSSQKGVKCKKARIFIYIFHREAKWLILQGCSGGSDGFWRFHSRRSDTYFKHLYGGCQKCKFDASILEVTATKDFLLLLI